MMLFIFGYCILSVIVAIIAAYLIKKDGIKSLTWAGLVVALGAILIPILNIFLVISAILAGISFLWDEYADKPVFK